ncbi:MAG: FAD-dependent oxidoreductase [Bacteroidetes bacterium]|nr:FAD-dependent oxidoreductase [Bacteroidota bacterium]
MIARDGACISLWQTTAERYRITSVPSKDGKYDVIIAGGGISGVSTALLLQKAGLRCALLEARSLCFGTTGGTTAHLNTLMDTPYTTIAGNFGREGASMVARAAESAIALIKQNIAAYNIDCGFEDARAYLFSQDSRQSSELEDISRASLDAGLELSATEAIPIAVPFEKAIVIQGQAKFHPVRYVNALAKAFEEAGGVILEQCRVMGTEEKDGLEVSTSRGAMYAQWLIYTTHIPPGVNMLHLRCAPYRSYAMAVQLLGDRYPEGLTYDMYDPYHYYRTQKIDGEPFLIVGGEDHKTGHEDNTLSRFLKLEAHIRSWFSVKGIVHRWSSQYFEPTDGLPYIGRLNGAPERVLVATGYGGNGMTYSSVAAQLLADTVLDRPNPFSELFDPGRIKPIAGFSNFVKENFDVAKELISGLFSREKIESSAALAPDEGKVVKLEGESIAVYKDKDHTLHTVSPVCTHLKCSVTWNNAERSWDCPCHGARYDADGGVITGPADRDLKKIDT